MLRLIYLLRRKPELSQVWEAFQRYWRDQHGPLVASFATTLGIQRYVRAQHRRPRQRGYGHRPGRHGRPMMELRSSGGIRKRR